MEQSRVCKILMSKKRRRKWWNCIQILQWISLIFKKRFWGLTIINCHSKQIDEGENYTSNTNAKYLSNFTLDKYIINFSVWDVRCKLHISFVTRQRLQNIVHLRKVQLPQFHLALKMDNFCRIRVQKFTLQAAPEEAPEAWPILYCTPQDYGIYLYST